MVIGVTARTRAGLAYWFKSVYDGVAGVPRARVALVQAMRNPRKAWRALRRTGSRKWLRRLFASESEYFGYAAELAAGGELGRLSEQLGKRFQSVRGVTPRGSAYVHGAIKRTHAVHLYALVRKARPLRMVETGVCNGFSTAVILLAMERNGCGRLFSVDLPEYADCSAGGGRFWSGKGGAVVPAGSECGWLVPEKWRHRWELRLGRSNEVLPGLLDELGEIDAFLHDSEHSLENQSFEFASASRHLRAGGFLLASDATASPAFDRFVNDAEENVEVFWIDHSLAVAIKR